MNTSNRKRIGIASVLVGLLAVSSTVWLPGLLGEASSNFVRTGVANDVVDAMAIIGVLVAAIGLVYIFTTPRTATEPAIDAAIPATEAPAPETAEPVAVAETQS